MAIETYKQDRLEQSIRWYDRSSFYNRVFYYLTQCASIVCAAIIPFLSGLDANGPRRYSIPIGILGAVIAVVTAVSSIGRFHELWIKHRTTAEALQRERFLFEMRADPYAKDVNPDRLLVLRTEAILSKENADWAQTMLQPPPSGHGAQPGGETTP